MNTFIDKISDFLSKKFLSEVSIRKHAHGFRVTLSEGCSEIVTEIEDSIELALEKCLENYPKCVENLKKQEIERLEEQKKEYKEKALECYLKIKRLKERS